MLGSTSRDLPHHANCPVVVRSVRPEVRRHPRAGRCGLPYARTEAGSSSPPGSRPHGFSRCLRRIRSTGAAGSAVARPPLVRCTRDEIADRSTAPRGGARAFATEFGTGAAGHGRT
ncbi:hypothetical protein [Amycolatopsis sp. FDAARGOS 1241]|uniref:hypothetical protein n=1 Tax=Amycolatopsis sp. FDAARGOS 1241 TaxID=2778070 RepID=UPI00351C29A7